jgi:hypothetical protein
VHLQAGHRLESGGPLALDDQHRVASFEEVAQGVSRRHGNDASPGVVRDAAHERLLAEERDGVARGCEVCSALGEAPRGTLLRERRTEQDEGRDLDPHQA